MAFVFCGCNTSPSTYEIEKVTSEKQNLTKLRS